MMYEFKSLDSFITPALKARGGDMVYVVKNATQFNNGKSPYFNERVKVDGKEYTCIGVETFSVNIISEGVHIALLVKE